MVTDAFEWKSRKEAEILGVPGLPLVALPHPVGQLPPDEMRRLTDAAFPRIVAAIRSQEG